ncbi:unnamed protein product, partial [marine sediment metagenome]
LDTGVHGVAASTVCSETEADNKIAAHSTVKVKLETRDMETASGDVTYAGYGFQPTGLIIMGYLAGNPPCVGFSEPALAEFGLFYNEVGEAGGEALISKLYAAEFARQEAVVKTYNADGFTLTWTKSGTPTGIATLYVFAFRG